MKLVSNNIQERREEEEVESSRTRKREERERKKKRESVLHVYLSKRDGREMFGII